MAFRFGTLGTRSRVGISEARIDRAALRANFEAARQAAAGADVIGVVKADGYGHGAVVVARTLVEAGCAGLAVVTLEEAATLRDAGLEPPILVLGGVHDASEAREAVARSLTPVLHDARPLSWLEAEPKGCDVQVEVDSGMHRMGVPARDAPGLIEKVAAMPSLHLSGLFTHLARADETDLEPSRVQLRAFRRVLDALAASRIDPGQLHFANSAGLLVGAPLRALVPEASAVRPGLMLYGARPAPHLGAGLEPAMTFRTRVVQVRAVEKGGAVGYAALFRAERDTRIATLPVGYEAGLPVAASGPGAVLIAGRRFPIVGRVSMDYLTVDVGDAPVAPGDWAVIFGRDGDARLPVEEAAQAAGTIAYELMVRVGRRIPRVVDESTLVGSPPAR
jgi:alanine racemase